MKKIIACFFIAPFLAGCASKNNQLQQNGYYSNGEKFAYCRNPTLFNTAFIDYVNKTYMSGEGKKIASVTGSHSIDRNDLIVSVPLNCAGKFNMTNGETYDFNITITIPAVNSPTISKINYTKMDIPSTKVDDRASGICLKNPSQPGMSICSGNQNDDGYYEQYPTTEEDFKRNQKYMQTHQTYTCRTINPSYAEGVRIREYIVTDPSQCK